MLTKQSKGSLDKGAGRSLYAFQIAWNIIYTLLIYVFILLYCINVSRCITAFDCITACFVVFHYPSSIA